MRVADRMRQTFKLAGFTGYEVDYAVATFTAYIYGMTLPEIAWNATMVDGEYDADAMRAQVMKAAADFPDMLERIDMDTYEDPRVMRAVAFDFGLLSVLDGLERRLVT